MISICIYIRFQAKSQPTGSKRRKTRNVDLNQKWSDYLEQVTKTSKAQETLYLLKIVALKRELGLPESG
jgi:hypothetical protein